MRYAEKRRRGLAALGALCGLAATLGVSGPALAGQNRRKDCPPGALPKIYLHPRRLVYGHKPRSRTPQIHRLERMQKLTKSAALAGVIAFAATATPAVAGPPDVYSGPGGRGECAAGRGVLLIRHQLRRPGDRKHFYRGPVQRGCRYLFGIQPDTSRPGDRVCRAEGNNIDIGSGWSFDSHLGRGHNPLRR